MADARRGAVEVHDLVVVRGGVPVVDGVSATIAPGTVTGVLGPSGAGKTTLMRAIVGVQRITAGEVRVLGRPAGSADLRSDVGYLTQAPAVYGDLTVRENLGYFAAVAGADRDRIARLVSRMRLDGLTGRRVDRLSGGQRARVSLAVAMIGDPAVLVMDEPTVGLDPLLRRDLWHLFHRLAAGGRTLLVSTHVMDEARRCTDLMLLHEGRLLAQGTPRSIVRHAGAEDVETAFIRLVETGARLEAVR
jgi:ABC-2 type transport system ATP-binding protein